MNEQVYSVNVKGKKGDEISFKRQLSCKILEIISEVQRLMTASATARAAIEKID